MRMLGGRKRRWSSRRGGPALARTHRILAAAVALLAIGGLVLSLFVVHAIQIGALRHELRDLRDARERALIEQEALRERLAEADDPEAIESAARERLGWVLPGEEKVIFIGEREGE